MTAPTTRKYPRTLNEAFGPYCSGKIYEAGENPAEYPRGFMPTLYAIALVALVLIWVTR